MDKEMQKNIENELIENFKVFYSTINIHENIEKLDENVKHIVDEIKSLCSISDDVSLKVKFVCDMANGDTKHSKYLDIQEFNKNGVVMIDDAERLRVEIKAEFRKNGKLYVSDDKTPFYKSQTFIISENVKSDISKLALDSVNQGEGKMVAVDGYNLQEFSNNKIRFAHCKNIEV